jgi:Tfp pilus assembly protein PilV
MQESRAMVVTAYLGRAPRKTQDNMTPRRRIAGTTLVEMLIAILLFAIILTGIFPIFLTVHDAPAQGDARVLAGLQALSLTEQLKNYTTAEPGTSDHLAADACVGCPGAPNCWALAVCDHDVTAMLDPSFRDRWNATMSYTVSEVASGSQIARQVKINVNWQISAQ